MITIIYTVEVDKAEDEKDWLRMQKVTATFEIDYCWHKQRNVAHFGMIVSPDAALAIKLRHNLDAQYQYRPR